VRKSRIKKKCCHTKNIRSILKCLLLEITFHSCSTPQKFVRTNNYISDSALKCRNLDARRDSNGSYDSDTQSSNATKEKSINEAHDEEMKLWLSKLESLVTYIYEDEAQLIMKYGQCHGESEIRSILHHLNSLCLKDSYYPNVNIARLKYVLRIMKKRLFPLYQNIRILGDLTIYFLRQRTVDLLSPYRSTANKENLIPVTFYLRTTPEYANLMAIPIDSDGNIQSSEKKLISLSDDDGHNDSCGHDYGFYDEFFFYDHDIDTLEEYDGGDDSSRSVSTTQNTPETDQEEKGERAEISCPPDETVASNSLVQANANPTFVLSKLMQMLTHKDMQHVPSLCFARIMQWCMSRLPFDAADLWLPTRSGALGMSFYRMSLSQLLTIDAHIEQGIESVGENCFDLSFLSICRSRMWHYVGNDECCYEGSKLRSMDQILGRLQIYFGKWIAWTNRE
jgi:hypothetical protein